MIYKLVTRVIQYFCFPERPMKGGGILDFQKRGVLEKEVMIPLTKYAHTPPSKILSPPKFNFLLKPPPPNYFGLKLGGAATMKGFFFSFLFTVIPGYFNEFVYEIMK